MVTLPEQMGLARKRPVFGRKIENLRSKTQKNSRCSVNLLYCKGFKNEAYYFIVSVTVLVSLKTATIGNNDVASSIRLPLDFKDVTMLNQRRKIVKSLIFPLSAFSLIVNV